MKFTLYLNNEPQGPYSLEQVWALIDAGKFSTVDLAWDEKQKQWVPFKDLISRRSTGADKASTTIKAGWICLILGFCTFWIFGIGIGFLAAAFCLSIAAICQDRLAHGLALLISTVFSFLACFILVFLFAIGTAAGLATALVGGISHKLPPPNVQRVTTPVLPTRPIIQSTPNFTPQYRQEGQFIKPSQFLASQEALTTKDISFMLRGRVHETEIVDAVHQRGLVRAIAGFDAASLKQDGASQYLLAELANLRWVLTPAEYQRYISRQSSKAWEKYRAQSQPSPLPSQTQSSERRRLQELQNQELANAAKDQRDQAAKQEKTKLQMDIDRTNREFINQNHFTPGTAELIQKTFKVEN